MTSDHLDRHGSRRGLPARQAPPRRARGPGRRARPQRSRTRSWAAYAGLGTAPLGAVPDGPPGPGRPRRRRRLDRGRGRGATADRGRRDRGDRPGRRDHAGRRAAASRVATTSRTPSRRSPSGCCSASRPTRSAAPAAAFTGVEHRLETVALDRRRPVRQRLAGHPARRGHRRAARVPGAGRAHRRRPRQGRRPRRAGAASSAETGARGGPHRRERPGPRGQFRAAGLARTDARGDAGRGRRRGRRRSPATSLLDRPAGAVATVLLSPAAASASTCSWTTRPAVARSSAAVVAPLRHGGGRADGHDAARRRGRDAAPASAPQNTLQRERHEPEYWILVAVVALAAIGILMVYSSSAIKALPPATATRSRSSGRRSCGRCSGIVAMVVMMRVDYRWLRLASVPMFVVGVVVLVLVVRPGDQHRGRRLGALAPDRAAAGGPPGRVREARARRLPRPLVRQAGQRVSGVPDGHRPVPLIIAARSSCSSSSSRTWAPSSVLALTAFTMFFLAGANLVHLLASPRRPVPRSR